MGCGADSYRGVPVREFLNERMDERAKNECKDLKQAWCDAVDAAGSALEDLIENEASDSLNANFGTLKACLPFISFVPGENVPWRVSKEPAGGPKVVGCALADLLMLIEFLEFIDAASFVQEKIDQAKAARDAFYACVRDHKKAEEQAAKGEGQEGGGNVS